MEEFSTVIMEVKDGAYEQPTGPGECDRGIFGLRPLSRGVRCLFIGINIHRRRLCACADAWWRSSTMNWSALARMPSS